MLLFIPMVLRPSGLSYSHKTAARLHWFRIEDLEAAHSMLRLRIVT